MAVHQANTGAENQKIGVCSAHDTESVTNQHGHLSCTVQSMFVPFASWYATESGLVPQPHGMKMLLTYIVILSSKKLFQGLKDSQNQ